MVYFHETQHSGEGPDLGQESSIECTADEVPLDLQVLEPRGKLRLEMGTGEASSTTGAQKQIRGWWC